LQIPVLVLAESQHLHQLHTHLVVFVLEDRDEHLSDLVGVEQMVWVGEGGDHVACGHSQTHGQAVVLVFVDWHRNRGI